jgi:glycosyltransferase involved in cell wall biosynthesis
MRFAFVSTMHSAIWGGSEELWSQAARQLKREGHDVLASVVFWMCQSDRLKALAREGIRVEGHPFYDAGRTRRWREKLRYGGPKAYHDLKQFDPDLVVVSQGSNSGGFDWARVCREAEIPYAIIVQCNDEHWWFGNQLGEANASYNAACRVFCVSRNNLDLLRSQLGASLPNGEVVWNPYNVSTERIAPWPDESGGWRLACVARIDLAAKGQDVLLKTLARPEWRNRSVELNLFGTGPDEEVLRRMAEMLHLKNVHFRGHVSDIAAIWEQNHLLVLPSRFEGLPLALVEAMWRGRPQVVTDVGGNAELCADGETGFVADAPTVAAFSNAMERAWEHRKTWPAIGNAARARAEEIVPREPIPLFCERLKAIATEEPGHSPRRRRR